MSAILFFVTKIISLEEVGVKNDIRMNDICKRPLDLPV